MAELEKVVIEAGSYKWIQIEGPQGTYVRGYRTAGYHADCWRAARAELNAAGLNPNEYRCAGGGIVDASDTRIRLWGTSYGFGSYNRAKVAAALKEHCEARGLEHRVDEPSDY